MAQKQQHLDRLSSTDAGFLHNEGSSSHMHIGGVLLFEGHAPAFAEVLDHVRDRLHLVPRYRQKLATPPLDSGRQIWVDDSSFNIEYHVRNAALPSPGSIQQLLQMAARLASQPLDRTKPLWEMYVVEGIEPGSGSKLERFAVVLKNHHALVDGVSGVDLATVLFDIGPEPWKPDEDLEPWIPQPEPSPIDLLMGSLRGAARASVELATRAVSAASSPARTADTLKEAAEGIGELLWAALNPAPETPLNVPIGPHRRFAIVRQELADYKAVKNAFGGTVNDAVLAVVSGALAGWLHSRGISTDGLELRAMVPVSVRTDDERHQLGNRLVAMRGPLPVYIADAVKRLHVVSAAMDELKESKQAVGAATLAAVTEFAPPTILAQAARINFSTRLFNLLVTNIPGPQVPLYMLGKQMQDVFPLAFLPDNQALAVAIMSYNGRIEFGLLGDFDALPDLDVIAAGIESSLQELLFAAGLGSAAGSKPQVKRHATSGSFTNGAAATKPPPRKRKPAGQAAAPAAAASDAEKAKPAARATSPTKRPAPQKNTASPNPDKTGIVTSSDSDNSEAEIRSELFPGASTRRKTTGPAADMRAKRSRGAR